MPLTGNVFRPGLLVFKRLELCIGQVLKKFMKNMYYEKTMDFKTIFFLKQKTNASFGTISLKLFEALVQLYPHILRV